jgi:hypothetical protein
LAALRSGDLALRATVRPACVRPGERAVARVEAVPGSSVSLVVAFADGTSGGAMYAGPTDAAGAVDYPFVVPATAPVGDASLLSAGHDPATQTSGTVAAPFRVATRCT